MKYRDGSLNLSKHANAVDTDARGLSTITSEPLSACYQIVSYTPSTGRNVQVLKTRNACLFQMGVDCFLWDEYSFHLDLLQGPHNQPKRNAEVNEKNAAHS